MSRSSDQGPDFWNSMGELVPSVCVTSSSQNGHVRERLRVMAAHDIDGHVLRADYGGPFFTGF